jgi:hypothetical protein
MEQSRPMDETYGTHARGGRVAMDTAVLEAAVTCGGRL